MEESRAEAWIFFDGLSIRYKLFTALKLALNPFILLAVSYYQHASPHYYYQ